MNELCKICNNRTAIVYPLCELEDGSQFMYGVCMECRDKVPYKVIPIKVTLDEGYFYCPIMPPDFKPTVIDVASFKPQKGILTKYGKKLLEEGAKHYGKIEIKNDSQNTTDGTMDGDSRRG